MTLTLKAILAAAVCALPLTAEAEITVTDAYARAASANAKSGAAFFVIQNTGTEDDQLIDARSDVAAKVELHTHIADGNGVMQMRRDEDGFPVPANGTHALARGGDHVMFMGLKEPFDQGKIIHVTLVFEKAGEIEVDIPVDLERQDAHGAMQHGNMEHGKMDHGKMAN
ncbi:copper chaperone PCu(A)C [Donghicola sp. C2-DW-16]|uniref:Copper chaperone PCu(A)C n=1 Tax=Donghicola mangrovi TaxID=2729614 RepID=A0ABX2PGV6_9RHOB|nr:copper chaperone PCu(A)C [Donghicola mangrovi]NVO28304.1 copper chaperone PCu(A)C [Donghicola mangrovi]